MPLPPYIDRAADAEDSTRYQTVYATSPARSRRRPRVFILHRKFWRDAAHLCYPACRRWNFPAGAERDDRRTSDALRSVHDFDGSSGRDQSRGAILAVGTTWCGFSNRREAKRRFIAQEGATEIFIYPPYEFRAVDRLLTNFHLPRSTLLMLVSAFAGREFILRAYAEAVRERYRFYSYGDCMLIL